ncbi:M2 family metallopeptidase [Numidum massiliense]|uniref:M2 family metallopeptidase n=1 Tax=Numidum massiliense TaxID=1522315 RepID=UPI0006D55964|nr:M2 family metallopeptidase [Numidum massiliense]
MAITEFLRRQNEALIPLYKESALTAWMSATTGEEAWSTRRERALHAYYRFFADEARFEQVMTYRQQATLDPLQRRQLDDLYINMVRNQLDGDLAARTVKMTQELSHLFTTFRPTLNGQAVTNNDLLKILKESDDSHECQEAWLASKQIAKQAERDILALVAQRNAEARSLGFDNFYHMSYATEELDLDETFALFEEVRALTEEPYQRVKREIDEQVAEKFSLPLDELRPWHYGDPFFQGAPPEPRVAVDELYQNKDLEQLTADTFASMGFDITDLLAKSDLYPRENKYPFGFCTSMDREGDVRVLVNADASQFWMTALLHEFGHAVYYKHVDRALPFLLRCHAHTLTTEGVAMFFGRLNKTPAWIDKFLCTDGEGIQGRNGGRGRASQVAAAGAHALQRELLVGMRWFLAFVFFERELYERPEQDLNRRWWEIVADIQQLHPPEETHYPDWAAKMHFSLAPVSYQNYILGELTASQLQHYIETHVSDDWFTPEVGKYLREVFFAPGARWEWQEKIIKATGEPLNAQFFGQQVARV